MVVTFLKQISFNCSKAQHDEISKTAAEMGLNVASYCRMVILKRAKEDSQA